MPIYLTAEKKKDIFTQFGGTAANTGSTESQVALMTLRINELSKHLQTIPANEPSLLWLDSANACSIT